MPDIAPTLAQEIARRKALFTAVRERARAQFDAGAPGIQIAASIAQGTDEALLLLMEESMEPGNSKFAVELAEQGCVVAVGGTGRGDLAPYSDIDLLFLSRRGNTAEFQDWVARFVQLCWDSGVQLGHSTRDVNTCVTLARQDPQIATALVEARLLWGNQKLFEKLVQRFRRRVITSRKRQFIEDCLRARSAGWEEDGPPAQELEPDLKSSLGGLRDLHLIRWIGFARYGVKDIDSLRLKGALRRDDARKLKDAWEYLTRLRIDLHLSAGKPQDRLTRDEQLRLAEERGFQATAEQRPVEIFMQQYFHQSSELAAITRRFAALERPRSLVHQIWDMIVGHRAEQVLYVGPDWIEVSSRNLPRVCASVESMLGLYKAAALYNTPLAPRVTEAVKLAVPNMPATVSSESAKMFMDILGCTRALGPILRSMFDTGLLDIIIPDVTHIRNLLQFNQYHHFTVDEHTLRAVETATRFEREEGPIGTAYRSLRHKEILHLAVLLHDVGKGFEEDHCVLGERIAQRIGARLFLPEYQVEQLALLVLKHLEMADLAFRRDITDARIVVNFSREIGAPDTLRMLYVLTAADVTSVGPGTWTSWKAGLLAELFDRCFVILTGKRYAFLERERMDVVKREVAHRLRPPLAKNAVRPPASENLEWLDRRLRGFSPYYITCTPPEQIAEDLRTIERLDDTSIEVLSAWSDETHTTEYRIITRSPLASVGCFHKMCGVLAAKRLEILSADINTTSDGVVVDSYRVIDTDFEGEPTEARIEEIARTFREVLQGKYSVETLFQRNRRFGSERQEKPVSDLPTRVLIDNESSENRTIIDVFAHDRPGLLYTLARTLFELNLSIDMAKIATHFDQVVDVFYVQDSNNDRIHSGDRIRDVKERLLSALDEFEQNSYQQFVKRL